MSSHYSLIQYLPDPVTDEKINIGVVVYGAGKLECKFLNDWSRVQAFTRGHGDASFLKEFASELEAFAAKQPVGGQTIPNKFDLSLLEKISQDWVNCIQVTTPKGSLETPNDLLKDVYKRFLVQSPAASKRKSLRGRPAVVKIAVNTMRDALLSKLGTGAEKLIKRKIEIEGKVEKHHFDMGVENGHLLLGACGLSFEQKESASLDRLIDATAWAVDDVRRAQKKLPLAVLALPPKNGSKAYDRACKLFKTLDADLVAEDNLEAWSAKLANRWKREGVTF